RRKYIHVGSSRAIFGADALLPLPILTVQDRVIGVCQQSDGLPDGSPFIFVRVKTASAVTLWFNLFMVQLVYGSTYF
ncbi:hypothetical protein, partial [Yersinia pestis]|uniref:hypothetical protein n=3 Tax=Yersinia pestis TaxID=632 RepID=UPI00050BF634